MVVEISGMRSWVVFPANRFCGELIVPNVHCMRSLELHNCFEREDFLTNGPRDL